MASTAPEQKLKVYLMALRANLRTLTPDLRQEIIEELRSHVHECAESQGQLTDDGVTAVLERLGSPQDLAAQYTSECITAQAASGRSQWQVARRLCDWVAVGPAGLFVVSGSLVGYFLAAALSLCAIRKFFAPDRAGLWQLSEGLSLRLGFGAAPPSNGTELLGWWIVPLGLTTGIGLVLLTFRLLLRSRHWFRLLRTH
jgi:hypothetical protein